MQKQQQQLVLCSAVDGAPEHAINACILQHKVPGLVGVTRDLQGEAGSRQQQQQQQGEACHSVLVPKLACSQFAADTAGRLLDHESPFLAMHTIQEYFCSGPTPLTTFCPNL